MRRFALILLGLVLLQTVGQAQSRGPSWACSQDAVSDAANPLCVAADTTGLSRYITDVIAQSTTTTGGFFNVVFGVTIPTDPCSVNAGNARTVFPAMGATGQRYIGPANTSAPLAFRPPTPIRIPKGNDLCLTGDANANPVTIHLAGYLAP